MKTHQHAHAHAHARLSRVSVCMCLCITHALAHTHTRARAQSHTHTRTHTYTHTRIHACHGRRSEARNSLRPLYTGQLTARDRTSMSFCSLFVGTHTHAHIGKDRSETHVHVLWQATHGWTRHTYTDVYVCNCKSKPSPARCTLTYT